MRTHNLTEQSIDAEEQLNSERTEAVSYRGKPVAEIRPIAKPPQNIQERLEEMEREVTLVRSTLPRCVFRPGEPKPGALERFLADRNE